jgi:site-specific DNA-methyltransferase (adenine-specific)
MPDFDFRLGLWQSVLSDVECDALISDPPYGKRTHEGHNEGSMVAINGFEAPIDYSCWSPADVQAFVDHWSSRTRGWIVGMTSHDLIPAWETAFESVGRYAFAPIPYVDFGKGPRVLGDGSASWTVYIMTARPRDKAWLEAWRESRRAHGLSCSLDGAYRRAQGDVTWQPIKRGKRIGGKPLGLMRQIVGDYSAPGDLVCDPYGGHATTLRAGLELERRVVGSEVDPDVWAAGLQRLREPVAIDMFTQRVEARVEQGDLFGA